MDRGWTALADTGAPTPTPTPLPSPPSLTPSLPLYGTNEDEDSDVPDPEEWTVAWREGKLASIPRAPPAIPFLFCLRTPVKVYV